MKVTEVRLTKLEGDKALKAYASVCFDDVLVVDGFKVFQFGNDTVVKYPSKPVKGDDKKSRRNTAYALTAELRDEIVNEVLNAYKEA